MLPATGRVCDVYGCLHSTITQKGLVINFNDREGWGDKEGGFISVPSSKANKKKVLKCF